LKIPQTINLLQNKKKSNSIPGEEECGAVIYNIMHLTS
jgi:hypothetical protein